MSEANDSTSVSSVSLKDALIGLTEINAPAPLSNAVRDKKFAPAAGTLQFVPRDEQAEQKLIEIEKLIRNRSYKAAIREARAINIQDANLASTYTLMIQEKVVRAQVGLGDRYLAWGDRERAKKAYRDATSAPASDARFETINKLTTTAVNQMVKLRGDLVEKIKGMLSAGQYEEWCETHRRLQDSSILDHLKDIIPDVSLVEGLGSGIPPHWPPKDKPGDGWTDPPPVDELANEKGLGSVVLERPVLKPGAAFATMSSRPVGLAAIEAFSVEAGRAAMPRAFSAPHAMELRASSTLPLMSAMLTAHARILALDKNLNAVGLSAGSMPIYRYAYLVDQARHILEFIAGIDARMAPMQFQLDDFNELVDTIRRHIDENASEIQALDNRISELQTNIATLSDGNQKIGVMVQQLKQAEDDCTPKWWEILLSIGVVILATAVGALIGFLLGGPLGAVAGGLSSLVTSIGLTIKVWNDREINCDNVSQARQDFQTAQSALQAALSDNQAELHHSLLQRDAIIATLASLQDTYDEAVTSNQARVLNAATLSRVLGVLDSVRSTAILRAHALARLAQDAYNADNDLQINVIAGSHSDYLDQDARGYTAAATLQRDLEGLEHIRLTGRTRKQMQLTQMVSLSKHYPSTFAAILTAGFGRFATRLSDFDRWFPGTYMHRLKEVRVEVLVDDKPQPIRGYLSNDGVSFVRFVDHGNKVAVDDRDVLAEPDTDLRKLCYKRRRRHHAVETMAFPSSDSFLYEARATELQRQERNFFEGCGLESTWQLEFTPEQELAYARITDVKVYFQFEALFDPALKSVVESKRYQNRNETALISVRKLLQDRGTTVDFSQPVVADITSFMFEAPSVDKLIREVGVVLRPKQAPLLSGVAKLRLNFQNQAAVEVETNDQGIVATDQTYPAGNNTNALRGLIQGKSAIGSWMMQILSLPAGITMDDIDDVLLMIPYSFKAA
ncbi:MAG TPA: hypothetical protein VJ698_01640 [Noviherbaspirillum sp.]|uniref:Tc toxin subunit A-related protein n=1 Tax=Noviherbaspirillum sp. TaxID=1926288 RepID=UPI002B47A181|nr:hypothetical protein [Noviherbaspirillum sp.]HJV84150.1 hypothetical protein [Noviherbaspirillum sp.]